MQSMRNLTVLTFAGMIFVAILFSVPRQASANHAGWCLWADMKPGNSSCRTSGQACGHQHEYWRYMTKLINEGSLVSWVYCGKWSNSCDTGGQSSLRKRVVRFCETNRNVPPHNFR